MPPRFPGLESGNDVRHDLVGRDLPGFDAMTLQQAADVGRRLAGITGRVRAPTADEAAEEIEQYLAVTLDPVQQFRLAPVHIRCSGCAHPSSTRSRIQLSISWTSGSRWEKRPGRAHGESSPRCCRSDATMSSSIVMSQRL